MWCEYKLLLGHYYNPIQRWMMKDQWELDYYQLPQSPMDYQNRSKIKVLSLTRIHKIQFHMLTGQWFVKLVSASCEAHICDDSSKPICCKLQTKDVSMTFWRHNNDTVVVAFKNKPRPHPGVVANWLVNVDGTCRKLGKRMMPILTKIKYF